MKNTERECASYKAHAREWGALRAIDIPEPVDTVCILPVSGHCHGLLPLLRTCSSPNLEDSSGKEFVLDLGLVHSILMMMWETNRIRCQANQKRSGHWCPCTLRHEKNAFFF
jgi:hypothetical protein